MWEDKIELKYRYDSTAYLYDRRYRDIQRFKFHLLQEHLKGADSILDVGCGTGLSLEEFSGLKKLVVGIDFSGKMLEEARKRFASMFLVLSDADYLPFQKETFDVVFSLTLIQNMPDPGRTVREMARVTRREGKVIVTGLGKKYSAEQLQTWFESANLKPIKVGKIPNCEDVLCVGRRKK